MKTHYVFSKTSMVCLLLLSMFLTVSSFSQSWNAIGTGTGDKINASIVYNNQLVVAGEFTTAGGNSANHIARWTGSAWQPLGTGMDSAVNALIIYNTELYACGKFTTAGGVSCNRIARWNGSIWQACGLGLNGEAKCMLVYSSQLRVGGKFTTAGGITCNRIARWDGTTWSLFTAPGNGANDDVNAMTLQGNGDMIIGGAFTNIANTNANRIVRYNGAWFTLGAGLDNGACNALWLYNASVYAGGTFSTIGGVTVNNIARWSGTNWNNVGTGANGPVNTFGVYQANLVIGGSFTTMAGTNANSLCTYNGTTVGTFGAGITGGAATVNAVTLWSNVFVASGSFTTAGSPLVGVNNLAGWGATPAAPTLVSPANSSIGISVNPVFDWNDVANGSTYGMQASVNPNFTTTVINVTGLATSTYSVMLALQYQTTYFWRANAANGLGTGPFSSIWFFTTSLVGIINQSEIPLEFNLYQNYPNPFNPSTKIRFDLPSGNTGAKLNLSVYDVDGRLVSTLLNTDYAAGKWEVDFNASSLPSGAYFCKITAGDYSSVNKMVLVK